VSATDSLETSPDSGTQRRTAAGLPAGPESSAGGIGADLAGFILPFALLLYLGLKGGGYDQVVRSEAAIVVWAVVIGGALSGLLAVARPGRTLVAGVVLLAALTGWTALSMVWTESGEQTFEEIGRLVAYLGVFVLGLGIQGRNGLRRTLAAVAAAIAVLAAFALTSRLNPDWFPVDRLAQAQSDAAGRLNYPLNSWNGLAALMAVGLPLLIGFAAGARRTWVAALASAAIPIVGCTAYLTYSRSGVVAAGIAAICMVALAPRRAGAALVALLSLITTALAVAAAAQRPAIEQLVSGPDAGAQRVEMALVVLALCAAAALIRIAFTSLNGAEILRRVPRPSAPPRPWLAGALVVLAILAAIVFGSDLSRAWNEFKDPANSASAAARFDSTSGNGRYQYWSASIDAGAQAPITGIGAGAWELWWAREATLGGFTRFAHSLYLETFAELGIVGLAALVGFLAVTFVATTRRIRRAGTDERWMLAAGFGAFAGFAVAAAFDWNWQLAVIPVAALFVAAALLTRDPSALSTGRTRRQLRIGVTVGGLIAIAVLVVSVIGARALEEGEKSLAAGEPEQALEHADSAAEVWPWAVTPLLLRAEALQSQGRFAEAAEAAEQASAKEETNWRPWYQLYLIEGAWGREVGSYQVIDGAPTFTPEALPHFERGRDAYARAQELNPLAPFLSTAPTHVTFEPTQ
jgi:hypothetical protein